MLTSRKLPMLAISLCFFQLTQAQSPKKIPITSSSKSALLAFEKARSLANIRSFDEAEVLLKEALSQDSTFAMAYLHLAMLRDDYDVRRKMLAKAMQHLDGISTGEKIWIRGRNAFYVEGKNDAEFDCFKQLVELYPDDAHAQYLFGYMNLHHGRYNPDTAISHLEKSIEIDADLVVPYNELAYAYMGQRAFDKAQRAVSGYIRLLPDQADPYDTQADLYLRRGNYTQSIEAYEKVLAIDPTYPWAIMGKAANLDFVNRHQEARQILKKLHDLDLSDYQDRHKWRAFQCSYIDKGDIEGALNNLMEQNNAAKINNDFHQRYFSYLRYVRLCFQTGQTKRGMEIYNEWNSFVQQNSKRAETRDKVANLKNYYLAHEALMESKPETAVEQLDIFDAVSAQVTNDAKILRSEIHLFNGKLDKAQAILETLDVENNAYNMFALAQLYQKQNKMAKSQALYKDIRDLYDLRDQDYAFVRRKALKEID